MTLEVDSRLVSSPALNTGSSFSLHGLRVCWHGIGPVISGAPDLIIWFMSQLRTGFYVVGISWMSSHVFRLLVVSLWFPMLFFQSSILY